MIRVISIEDDPATREALDYLFENTAPGVIELEFAECYAEGVARLKTDAFDVVLLDLVMHDSPGKPADAVREVKAAQDIPVIVLSGIPDGAQKVADECLEAGADDFFSKALINHHSRSDDGDMELLPRVIRKAHKRNIGRKAHAT